MKTVIFCDFDGTVARRDVGYSLFHHFSGGRNEALIPDWKAGRLSSRDCLRQEAAMVSITPAKLDVFLESLELDPGFPDFVEITRRAGVELQILSDGLDLYIQPLLSRYGLDDLPVRSNHGRIEEDRLVIEFPRPPKTCPRCGTCKGEVIEDYRAEHAGNGTVCRVAFVGDGYSDACAAGQADLLLAKKDLAQYCISRAIPYTAYRDFHEVTRLLIAAGYLPAPS